MQTTAQPASDERLWAALAHGSVILFIFGPIVSLLVWMGQRGKSRFARFQALQALGYQVLTFWLWLILGVGAVFFFAFGVPVAAIVLGEGEMLEADMSIFLLQLLLTLPILALWGLSLLVGLLGAGFCLLGIDFCYPLMGGWLEARLAGDEAYEDSWLAAMCHAIAVVFFWGIFFPLIIWFTQKERSLLLRFQVIQALVYQLISAALYGVGMIVYFILWLFMMFTMVVAAGSESAGSSPLAVVFLVLAIVVMLIWLACALLVPLYYLLAGIASLRVARGHNFRYPFLGGWLARQLVADHPVKT